MQNKQNAGFINIDFTKDKAEDDIFDYKELEHKWSKFFKTDNLKLSHFETHVETNIKADNNDRECLLDACNEHLKTLNNAYRSAESKLQNQEKSIQRFRGEILKLDNPLLSKSTQLDITLQKIINSRDMQILRFEKIGAEIKQVTKVINEVISKKDIEGLKPFLFYKNNGITQQNLQQYYTKCMKKKTISSKIKDTYIQITSHLSPLSYDFQFLKDQKDCDNIIIYLKEGNNYYELKGKDFDETKEKCCWFTIDNNFNIKKLHYGKTKDKIYNILSKDSYRPIPITILINRFSSNKNNMSTFLIDEQNRLWISGRGLNKFYKPIEENYFTHVVSDIKQLVIFNKFLLCILKTDNTVIIKEREPSPKERHMYESLPNYKINFEPLGQIKYIAASNNNMIVVTKTNVVYVVGKNENGQLGTGSIINVLSLQRIEFTQENIIEVIIQKYRTFIRTDDSLYTCGHMIGTGLRENTENPLIFTKVNTPFISQISVGDSHCVILDTDGYIWISGENKQKQLDFKVTNQESRYREIPDASLHDKLQGNRLQIPIYEFQKVINYTDIKQVVCYQNETVILTLDNKIFKCGSKNEIQEIGEDLIKLLGENYTIDKIFYDSDSLLLISDRRTYVLGTTENNTKSLFRQKLIVDKFNKIYIERPTLNIYTQDDKFNINLKLTNKYVNNNWVKSNEEALKNFYYTTPDNRHINITLSKGFHTTKMREAEFVREMEPKTIPGTQIELYYLSRKLKLTYSNEYTYGFDLFTFGRIFKALNIKKYIVSIFKLYNFNKKRYGIFNKYLTHLWNYNVNTTEVTITLFNSVIKYFINASKFSYIGNIIYHINKKTKAPYALKSNSTVITIPTYDVNFFKNLKKNITNEHDIRDIMQSIDDSNDDYKRIKKYFKIINHVIKQENRNYLGRAYNFYKLVEATTQFYNMIGKYGERYDTITKKKDKINLLNQLYQSDNDENINFNYLIIDLVKFLDDRHHLSKLISLTDLEYNRIGANIMDILLGYFVFTCVDKINVNRRHFMLDLITVDGEMNRKIIETQETDNEDDKMTLDMLEKLIPKFYTISYVNIEFGKKINQPIENLPNCGETVILNLFNYILYNENDNILDVNKLPDGIQDEIRQFYQLNRTINDTKTKISSFSAIFQNLQEFIVEKEAYESKTNKVKSGYLKRKEICTSSRTCTYCYEIALTYYALCRLLAWAFGLKDLLTILNNKPDKLTKYTLKEILKSFNNEKFKKKLEAEYDVGYYNEASDFIKDDLDLFGRKPRNEIIVKITNELELYLATDHASVSYMKVSSDRAIGSHEPICAFLIEHFKNNSKLTTLKYDNNFSNYIFANIKNLEHCYNIKISENILSNLFYLITLEIIEPGDPIENVFLKMFLQQSDYNCDGLIDMLELTNIFNKKKLFSVIDRDMSTYCKDKLEKMKIKYPLELMNPMERSDFFFDLIWADRLDDAQSIIDQDQYVLYSLNKSHFLLYDYLYDYLYFLTKFNKVFAFILNSVKKGKLDKTIFKKEDNHNILHIIIRNITESYNSTDHIQNLLDLFINIYRNETINELKLVTENGTKKNITPLWFLIEVYITSKNYAGNYDYFNPRDHESDILDEMRKTISLCLKHLKLISKPLTDKINIVNRPDKKTILSYVKGDFEFMKLLVDNGVKLYLDYEVNINAIKEKKTSTSQKIESLEQLVAPAAASVAPPVAASVAPPVAAANIRSDGFKIGQQVIWRENKWKEFGWADSGKTKGPYQIIRFEDQNIILKLNDGDQWPVSSIWIEPYKTTPSKDTPQKTIKKLKKSLEKETRHHTNQIKYKKWYNKHVMSLLSLTYVQSLSTGFSYVEYNLEVANYIYDNTPPVKDFIRELLSKDTGMNMIRFEVTILCVIRYLIEIQNEESLKTYLILLNNIFIITNKVVSTDTSIIFLMKPIVDMIKPHIKKVTKYDFVYSIKNKIILLYEIIKDKFDKNIFEDLEFLFLRLYSHGGRDLYYYHILMDLLDKKKKYNSLELLKPLLVRKPYLLHQIDLNVLLGMLRIIGNNIEGWSKPDIEIVLNNNDNENQETILHRIFNLIPMETTKRLITTLDEYIDYIVPSLKIRDIRGETPFDIIDRKMRNKDIEKVSGLSEIIDRFKQLLITKKYQYTFDKPDMVRKYNHINQELYKKKYIKYKSKYLKLKRNKYEF